jgi:histone deacetylase 11
MSRTAPVIVYHPRYNIRLFGMEKLHPFDTCKFERAWRLIESALGDAARDHRVSTDRGASDKELRLVHTAEYLASLKSPDVVARAVEVPAVGMLPRMVIERVLLSAMRWATRGTILAAEHAIATGAAIHLGGGFHHAGFDRGEGFCLYADISIAIASLRSSGRLSETDRVAVVDLDAHRGNGVARNCLTDDRIRIFDVYNQHLYPRDPETKPRVDWPLPLASGTGDEEYLRELTSNLPAFFDAKGPFALVIYNAGTDVYRGDPLGGFDLSADAILERDLFTLREITRRRIPWVSLTSGGYTFDSAGLIANSAIQVMREFASWRG